MNHFKKKRQPSLAHKLAVAALFIVGLSTIAAIGIALFGKKSLSEMSVEELQEEMKKCIDPSIQNYEQAAQIRDLIVQRKLQNPSM